MQECFWSFFVAQHFECPKYLQRIVHNNYAIITIILVVLIIVYRLKNWVFKNFNVSRKTVLWIKYRNCYKNFRQINTNLIFKKASFEQGIFKKMYVENLMHKKFCPKKFIQIFLMTIMSLYYNRC